MRISRKKRPDKPLIPHYRKNESIRAPEVRVLGENQENIGVMSSMEALAKAKEMELDLVEINPKANPPVVQILDFSHFKYQKEKEARKQKTNSHTSDIKGIRMSIRISDHDMGIRKDQAVKFLERGDRVKIELIMRGRENARAELGFEVLNKFYSMLSQEVEARYEQEPAKQANRISATIVKK